MLWLGLLLLAILGLVLGRRNQILRLAATGLLCLILGSLRFQLHPFDPCFNQRGLAYYNGRDEEPAWATLVGTIVRPPEERDTTLRVRLHAESLVDLGSLPGDGPPEQPVRGDILFTVDRYPELRYGDRIRVRGRLEPPPVFEGFDYKE